MFTALNGMANMCFLESNREGTDACLNEAMQLIGKEDAMFSTLHVRTLNSKLGLDFGDGKLAMLQISIKKITKSLKVHSQLRMLVSLNLKEAFLGAVASVTELMLCLGSPRLCATIVHCWNEYPTCHKSLMMQCLVALAMFRSDEEIEAMSLIHRAKKHDDRNTAKWIAVAGDAGISRATSRLGASAGASGSTSFQTLYSNGVSFCVVKGDRNP